MKLLVCGSRFCYDWRLLEQTLYEFNKEHDIRVLISGCAPGIDSLAIQWAMYNKTWDDRFILIEKYPADWKQYGKGAGPIRNQQMLDEGKPDHVIAFLAPNSRGTANMINRTKQANIPVEIINI